MIKISIITINYNDLKGLQKTFNSVVNQSNKEFEYVVIDGGSSDGGKEFLEQNSDKLAYWISEKDSGVYNAMNKGIKAAKGEYLLFLNSGDFLVDNTIINQVHQFIDGKVEIYYGNLFCSQNSNRILYWSPPEELSFSYFLDYSLPHPASFIKRNLFERYFYYSENFRIVSDWEFYIYCICKMNVSYKHIDLIVSDFDFDGISSVKENEKLILSEKETVIKKHFPLLFEDMIVLKFCSSKRFKQFKVINENKVRWKLLKVFMSILLIFKTVKMKKYVTKI